jgi:hypothetical protein
LAPGTDQDTNTTGTFTDANSPDAPRRPASIAAIGAIVHLPAAAFEEGRVRP